MVLAPTENRLVVSAAVPPVRLTVPSTVEEPLTKLTVPVGVPAPGAFTVTIAVNVTGWPRTDGLLLELRLVVVGPWLPTACTTLELLVRKFPSPPYAAVIAWLPAERADVLKVAEPPLKV